MPSDLSRYTAPPKYDKKGDLTPPDRILGWIREAEQEGIAFLKGNRAYEDIDKGIDIIAGLDDDPAPESLSNVYSNRLKRQLREVVATLSNLRPLWGYSTDNEAFKDSAQVLNQLVYSWWLGTFADRSIRQAMQWACVSTGWISPTWDPDFWYFGRGDIALQVYGPRDVLPIQMGKDLDIQRAYAAIIQQEVPLFKVCQAFPEMQDLIKADHNSPSWFKQRLRKAVPRFVSPVANSLFGEKETTTTSGPTCDIFDCYIQDLSINKTGKPIRMGLTGSPWEYQVPYLGQEIAADIDSAGNVISTRQARHADCMLYPLRRRIRATRNAVLYDGPSEWWHGKVPLIKFTVDDWPNEFLGFGLVRDVYSLQCSYNKVLRAMEDAVEKSLRPDVYYDPNLVDRGEVKRYDPRMGRRKIPMNFQMGKGFEVQPPPEIPQYAPAHLVFIQQEIDHMLAIRDMQNLAKANQIPSAESIDRILEMAGPLVTDISRGMERSLRDLGEMVKCLFYEFYTEVRKVKVMGASGLEERDFIFSPDTLIPESFRSTIYASEVIPQNLARAKKNMNGCLFHITPNSLHQIQQMTRKLLYLQLWRDGRYPIDPETVAEALDIPNFGTLPGDATDVLTRWQGWNQLMLETQMKAQAAVAQQQMAMQADAQMMGMGMVAGQATAEAQGGGEGKPNGHANEGRPPSGSKPPHIAMKDGGTRSSIEES
jgi:hypothetical protein